MRKLLLVLGIAAACASTATAGVIDSAQRAQAKPGVQSWSAWGGQIGIRWNTDLLDNIGVGVVAARDQQLDLTDRRLHEWFTLRESGGLEFAVRYGSMEHFTGGSLQMRGGYQLRLPDGGTIDLRNLTLRVRAGDPGILDAFGPDGKAWFYIDRVMFELADAKQTLAIRASDLRISSALARRIGHPESAGWVVADFALNTQVFVQGSDIAGSCSPYPWPGVAVPGAPGQAYQADLFMQNFSVSPAGCQSCDGAGGANDGLISWVPSSTLKNNVNNGTAQVTIPGDALGTSSALYTANIRWQQMFTGNVAPYNNDQHPYLIWNLYRTNADGSFEQIGRSGVKHAWLTTNGNCADSCHDGHALGRSCTDTYGTGNNDNPGDLGPRSEIIPATGQWGRCGSIWDGDCNGTEDGGNGNDSWTQRLKVRESQVSGAANQGATYMIDSWYIAREDVNIYNSMATVTATPQHTGNNWTFPGGGYKLGAAIDRWVSPVSPPANAMNSELSAPEGHAKVAVKAVDLGGGNWRYDYAVMNFDFARAVTTGAEPNLRVLGNKGFDSFSVPLPAGATATAVTFRDGDLDNANNWKMATTAGKVTWMARGRASSANAPSNPTLDWGTMFSFSVTVNRAPTSGQGTLHVAQRGLPGQYAVATLVPGT